MDLRRRARGTTEHRTGWRRARRLAALGALAGFGALGGAAGLLLWPGLLFSYQGGSDAVRLASDRPIPVQAGEALGRECARRLAGLALPSASRAHGLYIAQAPWRERLYFSWAPQAGGIAYLPGINGHAFLSGADFETGQLLKRGERIAPPRTLAYYCAHELAHVAIGEHLGTLRFLQLPDWVAEGLPDHVALEPREPFADLRAALGERPVDLPLMQRYGVYPRERLLVRFFLERRGWSVSRLLESPPNYEDALRQLRAHAEP